MDNKQCQTGVQGKKKKQLKMHKEAKRDRGHESKPSLYMKQTKKRLKLHTN